MSKAAVASLREYVIRHAVDDIPKEKESFGGLGDWDISVARATAEKLEIILRMDRALRVARGRSRNASNDARFHVGWRHLDAVCKELKASVQDLLAADRTVRTVRTVVKGHLKCIEGLRSKVGVHPKMLAVAKEVRGVIESGEKVLLFCDHHATAQELTMALAEELPRTLVDESLSVAVWKRAWEAVLGKCPPKGATEKMRDAFVDWLCADLIRGQTRRWMKSAPANEAGLKKLLKRSKVRPPFGKATIVEAATELFASLCGSKSSAKILENELLPCRSKHSVRVLGFLDLRNFTGKVAGRLNNSVAIRHSNDIDPVVVPHLDEKPGLSNVAYKSKESAESAFRTEIADRYAAAAAELSQGGRGFESLRDLMGDKFIDDMLARQNSEDEDDESSELSRSALGKAAPNQNARDKALFVNNKEPDAIIAIFNSPFGPDALVVTDRLSEGVDLHRYCRHLIHYELDPSPIRTVQRNGRIRRVGSWAAITGEPNRYAYPYFAGTRDEQLVRNMKKRIECFSLLLGGVPDIAMDKIGDRDEDWRKRVVDRVKDELKKAGNLLCKRR